MNPRLSPAPATQERLSGAEDASRQIVDGVFPLSTMEEGLWFIEQVAPGNSAYNLPEAWRLWGRLNVHVLEQSLNAVARRHETLRTIFSLRGETPVQIILAHAPLTLEIEDLRALGRSEATLRELLEAEARRPFDIRRRPPIRVKLYQISAEEHVLLVVLHHIISDDWSFGVLMRELSSVYNAYVEGREPALPELPIQYADFSVWQRENSLAPATQSQVAYWKRQLGRSLPQLALATDFGRPLRPSLKGKTEFFEFPCALTNGLKALSQEHGVTLFNGLLAAFQGFLHRLTRQTDIVVGSPLAGRGRMETEGLIGLFTNLHAFYTDVSGNPSFVELLSRAREAVLGAYSHQDIPFERVVETLQPERDPSRHPLFQVVLGLQTGLVDAKWELAGLTAEHIDVDNSGSKFDWSLLLTESRSGLRIRCEYCDELFAPSTMRRWLGHFEKMLGGIIERPERKLSQFPLLSDVERCELLREWNPAPLESVPQLCVHNAFEAQAARTPAHIAVTCEHRKLTYEELNTRANQLARQLMSLGVGPEVPVALCLERSLEMVIGILGVLKAGGVYVPLDPASPRERLEFMLGDSGARVVLTQKSLLEVFPTTALPVLCMSLDETEAGDDCRSNPFSGVKPGNTAYVIYTSGSTGRPKGVPVSHFNVVRLFEKTKPWFGFNESDVWTLFHSYAFDFSVWEVWGALLYGGRLIVVPYLVSRSPGEFLDLLAREHVTVLNQTPSAFRQLIWAEQIMNQNQRRSALESLRYVIFGGEALDVQTLKPWFELHGDQRPQIVNMYGITETTVHVTYRVIRQSDLERRVGSVIGKPIPDLRLYLLDEELQPVPRGVPGEICVGGAGVAGGYLNRPELTSARFVSDPHGNNPEARMYRSGDLARYTSQGELEYMGRMDGQLKVRGFRVEPGEIETVLNQHPGVRESVVLLAQGGGSSSRLVAYFVCKGRPVLESELRAHLEKRLPAYMIPAAFVPLGALPLTSNGKLDRRGLPSPESKDERPGTAEYVPPRNKTEELIAGIWRQMLKRNHVGIHDNFFQLGGHSLLATQVIYRVSAALGLDIPIRALFDAPTIGGLAESVARAEREEPDNAGPILPRGRAATHLAQAHRHASLAPEDDNDLMKATQGKDLKT